MTYNNPNQQAVYLPSGDPETFDSPTLAYPGQLGKRFTVKQPTSAVGEGAVEAGRNKTYRIVQADSSMSVAPYAGAVAVWSDKSRYKVTTDVGSGRRGQAAGVFQYPVTRGNFCCIQVGGPATTQVEDADTGAAASPGRWVVPSATAGKADVLNDATAPTFKPLGQTTGTINVLTAMAVVDLDVPDAP